MQRRHKLKHLPRKNIEQAPSDTFPVSESVERFIVAKRAEDCTEGTLEAYRRALGALTLYLAGEGVQDIYEFDRAIAERFMAYVNTKTTHNPGGKHLIFRVVKTFFGWLESIGTGYTSPMWRFKGPRVEVIPLKGLDMKDFERMVKVVDGPNKRRDLAILYFLADSGLRAQELLDLQMGDVDLISGKVSVEKGKWRKSRVVFIGNRTRKALKLYYSEREEKPSYPVFCSDEGFQLTYAGLRQIIRRLSDRADIDAPGLHDFRRLFALTMHRNGVDDITLGRLMGHTTTEVLKRYIAEDEQDLEKAHKKSSPIDVTFR